MYPPSLKTEPPEGGPHPNMGFYTYGVVHVANREDGHLSMSSRGSVCPWCPLPVEE